MNLGQEWWVRAKKGGKRKEEQDNKKKTNVTGKPPHRYIITTRILKQKRVLNSFHILLYSLYLTLSHIKLNETFSNEI